MPSVIVPVGLNLGPVFRYVTPPDPTPGHWEVRLGDDSEELTDEEFYVWGRAFLDPERHARLEIGRDSLRRDAIAAGDGDPEPIIDQLLERGLLVEYDTEESLEKAFRRLRIFPLAEGMGNTPEETDRFHLGHNGVSLVKVSYTIYGMLVFSSTVGQSLWDACVNFQTGAVDLREAGEDVEATAASDVAREIAVTAPMMIASGCAFFDVAR
jgi:hypothetical protein